MWDEAADWARSVLVPAREVAAEVVKSPEVWRLTEAQQRAWFLQPEAARQQAAEELRRQPTVRPAWHGLRSIHPLALRYATGRSWSGSRRFRCGRNEKPCWRHFPRFETGSGPAL